MPEYLSLDEYYTIVRKAIHKMLPSRARWIEYDTDYLSFLVECVIMADQRYDSARGRTRKSYRNQCILWGVMDWEKKRKDRAFLGLPNSTPSYERGYKKVDDRDELDRVREVMQDLDYDEAYIIQQIIFEERTRESLANELKISTTTINRVLSRGLRKIKEVVRG